MLIIKDAQGRELVFNAVPQRVVSLIPSITESICELGLADYLVGISKYCVHPEPELKDKTKVGGQKNPDLEAIARLEPDLIILNVEENRPEHIEYLSERYPCWLTYPRRVTDASQLLSDLGTLFCVQDRARSFIERIDAASTLTVPSQRSRTLYLIWRGPWMSLNQDTFIHDVLHQHGFDNVFADHPERYFEVSEDDIRQADPEVIFLPNEPYRFLEKHKAEFRHLPVSAVARDQLFLVDGTYFCWYGTRTARAYEYIREVVAKNLNQVNV